MSDWTYLFPTLEDAPEELASRRPRAIAIEDPRVSVYCLGDSLRDPDGSPTGEFAHEARPWLFGSFEPLYSLLERTEKLEWAIVDTYPTGDGHALPVGRSSMRFLVDDRPVTEESAQYEDSARADLAFECGVCGMRRKWRAEKMRLPITLLASAGRREVSLKGLSDALGASLRAAKR